MESCLEQQAAEAESREIDLPSFRGYASPAELAEEAGLDDVPELPESHESEVRNQARLAELPPAYPVTADIDQQIDLIAILTLPTSHRRGLRESFCRSQIWTRPYMRRMGLDGLATAHA